MTRKGEAVLIRAVQPLEKVTLRADGPGRLCRALRITRRKHDGCSLTGADIQILQGNSEPVEALVSRRIGITKAKNRLLRFVSAKQIPDE